MTSKQQTIKVLEATIAKLKGGRVDQSILGYDPDSLDDPEDRKMALSDSLNQAADLIEQLPNAFPDLLDPKDLALLKKSAQGLKSRAKKR